MSFKIKKAFVGFGILLSLFISICFIPFNVDKLIPILKTEIQNQLGVKVELNKLILKIGPEIIIKSPDVNLSSKNVGEFAKIKGLKIKIDIFALISKEIKINEIRIDYINSTCKFDKTGNLILLKDLKQQNKSNKINKIRLKKYIHNLIDDNNNNYIFKGSEMQISDFDPTNSVKFEAKGEIIIDGKKHIEYDTLIKCQGLNFKNSPKSDILDFVEQIKNQDAYGSIISDLKVQKQNNVLKTDGTLTIDKLSFMNNGEKTPNSTIKLTMLGDKISINSTISPNKNDKISIIGFVTNSNNPNFNLAIKTDKTDLKDLLYFARLFSDISHLDQIKKIEGDLCSDFSIKGTLKHLKSEGDFKIKNGRLTTNKFNIDNLNSDIDLRGNNIRINTTTCSINSAPVTVEGEVSSNNVDINLIIDKFNLQNINYYPLKIKRGELSLVSNIKGTYKHFVPNIKAQINNLSGVYSNNIFNTKTINIDSSNLNSGDINIQNITTMINNKFPINIPSINANIKNDSIDISPCIINSNGTKLNTKISIVDYKNLDKLTFSLIANGAINPKYLLNAENFNNNYPVLIKINGSGYTQTINAQILQNPNAKYAITQPILINCSAKYSDSTLKIQDCSINSYNGIITNNHKKNLENTSKLCTITGDIENKKIPHIKNMKLSVIKTLPIRINHYSAKINGNLVINGKISSPEIIGNIRIPMLSYKYGGLSAKDISISLTKNLINFGSQNIKIFDNVLSVVGTAENNNFNKLKINTINIKSKKINMDNLSMFLIGAKKSNQNIEINNGTLFIENFILPTIIEPILVSELTSQIKLKNNIVYLSSISGNLYNGKILGNIKSNVNTNVYSGTIQGRGVSAGLLVKSLSKIKEDISGKLDFDMNLSSNIKSKLLNDANIRFIIKDGQMSTLGQVEHLLYAQNIINDKMLKTSLAVITRAISAKDTGLFKYLNGIIRINNEHIEIDSIKLFGPNMSLYVVGTCNSISNIANLEILGRLSNTMVSSLGAFGTFSMDKFKIALTGEDEEGYNKLQRGVENIPQLPQKNTKEFKAIISGPLEENSSVKSFMWISETEKEYKTKEIQQTNTELPKFIEKIPY